MSFAEKEAWKNSTPNCFTRCAGTVIISFLHLSDELARYSNRWINPCQHLPFSILPSSEDTQHDVLEDLLIHNMRATWGPIRYPTGNIGNTSRESASGDKSVNLKQNRQSRRGQSNGG